MKPEAIICDVDGTIAKHDIMIRSPYQHELAMSDLPRPEIIKMLTWMKQKKVPFGETEVEVPEVKIILVSGRSDKHRDLTLRWLKRHDVPFDELRMRTDGDNRSDAIVKREIYERYIEPYYRVWFVLDDRERVVDMWRKELGLMCLQVNYGNF